MSAKWIFFDLDDTLFDFAAASLASLRQLYGETAEIQTRFSSRESFIDEYHLHNKRMWDLHERGLITSDFLKAERFRLTLFPERQDAATMQLSYRLNRRYLELLGDCRLPVAGAVRLLEQLTKTHLIGVLTNGFTEVQYCKLRSTGLDRYIQRMVISDEIGVQKPDGRLFRYAEAATGAKPESTVMIGDNPQNDIAGAIDAGWKAIYFDCKGKPFESESDLYLGRVGSLAEAGKLLGECKPVD